MAAANTAPTENTEAPKRTRKPRDPNAVRVSRPAWLLASVNDEGKIVVHKFSRDASKLLIEFAEINKSVPNAQLVQLNAD